ncbi:MAG TPA: hypothetical protein VK858_21635 [Longimicrobiales bacterium]|nr:hypothetical protein [Longimicrobiales bacterium]
MGDIFDLAAWREVIASAFRQLGDNLVEIFPTLVGVLVLLLVGWGTSKLSEAVARRGLTRVGFDRVAARLRLPEMLNRAGIESPPSRIMGRLLFWIVMLTFVLSAVETLGLDAATSTIDRLVGYLPNLIAALLIVLGGLLVSRLVRGVVASGALTLDVERGQRLGGAAGGLVMVFFVVLAMEQLGIETTLLVMLITVLVGATALTLGIGFALGARPVIGHILAGHFLRQSISQGSTLEVDGRRGLVERVGPVDTLVKDDEHSWSIPNATLLDQVTGR